MNGFITLHERRGKCEVLINIEYIVAIRDFRTGNAGRKSSVYGFTAIETITGNHYEVIETQQEILLSTSKKWRVKL